MSGRGWEEVQPQASDARARMVRQANAEVSVVVKDVEEDENA